MRNNLEDAQVSLLSSYLPAALPFPNPQPLHNLPYLSLSLFSICVADIYTGWRDTV
jgi:hypothetical protein